jgi:catechol 2,3-dioxygenase-like lactoylglutathione lyase family enzyme
MSSRAGFILILVDRLDAEIIFYRRTLGVRELRTWSDAHLEKAVLFDMGTLKLILAQQRPGSPIPHLPPAAKGRVWLGLQSAGDLGAHHQTAGVGKSPQQISPVHDFPWGRGRCFYVVDSEGNPVIVYDEGLDTAVRPR